MLARLISSSGGFGGHPSRRMTRSMQRPALCAAREKLHISDLGGLLHPLPIPHRPWSHLSLDFVTGLPPSQGNTVILVVVDRFSKAAWFIPLPKLPSAKETAELIMNHVFREFGIPLDIVSDRGPQFSSRF